MDIKEEQKKGAVSGAIINIELLPNKIINDKKFSIMPL